MTSYTITNNDYFKSIEITFTEKPSEQIRNILKALRFRWHYTKKVWYGYANKQVLIDRLNTIISDNSIKVDPVNVDLPEPKTEPVNIDNVQPVKVDLTEKVETEKGFKNHNAGKNFVPDNGYKLLKKQEKALSKLIRYEPTKAIYTEKDGVSYIGNCYALFKINSDLISEELKQDLKAALVYGKSVKHFDSDKIENIYNTHIEKVNTEKATIYLTSEDTFTVTENKDIRFNKASTILNNRFEKVITFNTRLLNYCLTAFNQCCEMTVLAATKPAIINGNYFQAIIMPIMLFN